MRQDNRNNQSGGYSNQRFGGRSFNNSRSFGGNNRGSSDRTMYSAVCDECGNSCQVPFQPTSGKPIYCDNCFSKNKNRGGNRDGGRNDRRFHDNRGFNSNRGSDNNNQFKTQLDSLNIKLDQILSILKTTSQVGNDKVKPARAKTIKPKVKAVKKIVKKTVKKTVKKATKKK